MEEPIVVGIDIGTTKICTLVARLEGDTDMRILGVGIEPALGIKKGNVVDISTATQSISRSIEKAQRTSGLEIESALVSLAGSHVMAMNSRGVVGISGGVISQEDVDRALEAAMAVAMPHNREIIHVIQRGFTVDGQEGIQSPVNFSGFRLEVEAHIITAAAATVENLRQCVNGCNVDVLQFVLNPLASGEVVLNKPERDMGVCICDIGGGTSDLAIYINGDVWHTDVLPVAGNQITNDIAIGLHISPEQAEQIKKQYGHAITGEVGEGEFFTLRTFGDDQPKQISRRELAYIIEARVEEIFQLLHQEVRRSGYENLLPAGMILTGGTSQLPGIRQLAADVLNMPVRVARPENLVGLVDQLQSPAYSTSVGLLKWSELMTQPSYAVTHPRKPKTSGFKPSVLNWDKLKVLVERLLP
ncbi:MAG TPA: cell division protein FtsA [Anaerolineaceae bacterium]|jgi:cell division protein FtsA|nr:cell division protein FtsA [Anaerolineaceae bacterium]HPD63033.1 cell division protein FtsA [Anaerolineaceae bacterium]HQF68537.1 cell division protein FtsA [Anaerolineaceae bacterium]HQK04446.1 cell division protein FtsA [Anaerolineaceae bacterium]HRS74033.1 cell division protein FtsA [Anaerolineaceae bacterium]